MTWQRSYTTRVAMLCLVYGALSVAMCAPAFVRPNGVGHYDWDVHLFYYASVLKSVAEYGQWPFWNPWYCGGNVLWQNPQVAFLSPVYPLALLMSLPLAMKLNIVLHYWVGFIGMHLLLRRIVGVGSLPLVIYLASVFVGCGALALHIAEGHSTFLTAFYLPLLLFWFCRALTGTRLRDGLIAAVLLALIVLNGGFHILPMSVIGIGLLALVNAVVRRSWRPLLIAATCVIAGLAYAAPKIVPMVAFIESDRFKDDRAMPPNDSMTYDMLAHAYLDPWQTRDYKFAGQMYGWQEYGNYVGFPAVALIDAAFIGIFLVGGGGSRRWLRVASAIAAASFFALSLGEFGPWAPASLAKAVPILSNFRVPSRYTIAFVLFATITVACWIADVEMPLARRRSVRLLLSVLCLAAAGDLVWRNSARFDGIFEQAPLKQGFRLLRPSHTIVTDTTINAYTQDAPMLRALMANRSTFNCYEPLKVRMLSHPNDSPVSVEGGAAMASSVFTPNRIDFALGSTRHPTRVLMNQNFAPGWRSTLGPVTPDPLSGNIVITAPAGAGGNYSISYSPPGLVLGWLIFVGAVALSVPAWRSAQSDGLSSSSL